jgi:hypothetical protein
MKEQLRQIFKNNWLEFTIAPLMVMGFTFVLYGEAYFTSWQNFIKMTIPWQLVAVGMGILSEQCRRFTSRLYKRLDQTVSRLVVHFLGTYTIFTILVSSCWFLLKALPFAEVHPPNGKLPLTLLVGLVINVLMVTAYEAFIFFQKWKEAIAETEQLEKLNLESQFRSLQSQLNPHFLFNSLNVLSSLIGENPSRAERFVDELSNVYRYLLRNNEQELATVAEELRFIRSFSHLLETRHDKGISLIINMKKEILNKKLPALALQVLVENAVKHNEISPEKPLRIEIGEEGTSLFVRNNLQQKRTKPLSNRVGLENLRQRYKLLGVEGFGVKENGLFFSVALPTLS